MSVLILGGTGLIGTAVASLFEQKGWKVYVLARTEEKAKELRKKEIIANSARDVHVWEPIAKSVNVIIDAVGDRGDQSTSLVIATALAKLLSEDKTKVVIASSGSLMYGDTKDGIADESWPTNNIPKFAEDRAKAEKTITNAGGIALRVGAVFGRGGSIIASWMSAIAKGEANFHGTGNQAYSYVHVSDLAELYYLAALRGNEFRGHIFNAAHSIHTLREVIQAIAKEFAFTGELKFLPAQDPFSEALSHNLVMSSAKAKKLLGWNPSRDFITNVELNVEAFKASN